MCVYNSNNVHQEGLWVASNGQQGSDDEDAAICLHAIPPSENRTEFAKP